MLSELNSKLTIKERMRIGREFVTKKDLRSKLKDRKRGMNSRGFKDRVQVVGRDRGARFSAREENIPEYVPP